MSKQKKDFTQKIGAQKYLSGAQEEEQKKEEPKKEKQLKKDLPRMNLVLDEDLKEWIDKYHWTAKLTRNDLVCYILRSYKEALEAQEAEKKE